MTAKTQKISRDVLNETAALLTKASSRLTEIAKQLAFRNRTELPLPWSERLNVSVDVVVKACIAIENSAELEFARLNRKLPTHGDSVIAGREEKKAAEAAAGFVRKGQGRPKKKA